MTKQFVAWGAGTLILFVGGYLLIEMADLTRGDLFMASAIVGMVALSVTNGIWGS